MPLRDQRGFTLTELIVVMAIFTVVIMVTSNTFKTVITAAGQQSKSAETQIEGIVGLEVLRGDLEQAGFGLPWTFQSTLTNYKEPNLDGQRPDSFWASGTSLNSLKDDPNPPRAVQSGNTTFNLGDDGRGSSCLVIKSIVASTNQAAKKWTSIAYTATSKTTTTWDSPDLNPKKEDRVIVLRTTFTNNLPQRQLGVNSGGAFFSMFGTATYSNVTTLTVPHTDGDIFQVYGVDDGDTWMPFNRADYYVTRPAKMPATCAPGTGILYKSTANQGGAGSGFTEIPLLDCVADMQVVYGLDTSGAGFINSHLATPNLTTAQAIRDQVKEIRVYILAQEGKKDTSYRYPTSTVNVGEDFGGGLQGRTFNLQKHIGPEYLNYRWKIYTIVVRPKNLIQ